MNVVRHFDLTPHTARELDESAARVRRASRAERIVGVIADVLFYGSCALAAAGCVLTVMHSGGLL